MPAAKDFRRIVLGLEGAVESAHMGHPDFRANGRIFATLQHDPHWGALMLTPDQQKRLLADHPGRSSPRPARGAWLDRRSSISPAWTKKCWATC